jgi:hypothetical protein
MSDQDPSITLFADQQTKKDVTTTSSDTTSPVAVLVGEGRKYKDVDGLAKAYIEADSFINQLKTELAELREKAASAKTIDDVMERLKAEQQAGASDKDDKTGTSGLTPTDVRQIVSDAIRGNETVKQKQANLAKADAEMRKLFGDKAEEMFKQEASTPEMREALTQLASVSPDKFVALFSGQQRQGNATDTKTNVNTAAMGSANNSGRATDPACKEYYDNLRKTKPKEYLSSSVQLQMARAAEADPSKFFGQ